MGQMADAVQSARNAVAQAVASNSAAGLKEALQGSLSSISSALNVRFQGRYLFSGGQHQTQPVAATTLAALTAAPTIASLFSNDQLPTTDRLDDSTVVSTGFLADQLGTPAFRRCRRSRPSTRAARAAERRPDPGPGDPADQPAGQLRQRLQQSDRRSGQERVAAEPRRLADQDPHRPAEHHGADDRRRGRGRQRRGPFAASAQSGRAAGLGPGVRHLEQFLAAERSVSVTLKSLPNLLTGLRIVLTFAVFAALLVASGYEGRGAVEDSHLGAGRLDYRLADRLFRRLAGAQARRHVGLGRHPRPDRRQDRHRRRGDRPDRARPDLGVAFPGGLILFRELFVSGLREVGAARG